MGSAARKHQKTVWWSEPAIFLVISVAVAYIFRTFRAEANIMMRRHFAVTGNDLKWRHFSLAFGDNKLCENELR